MTPAVISPSGASCPGLIEAIISIFCHYPIWGIPSGASCPGLIEAWQPCWSCCQNAGPSGASCPGLIEAWSAPLPAGSLCSPSGASCPGLIEARGALAGVGKFLTAHPGLLAPASLKHPNGWRPHVGICPHPGLLAPASLKQVLELCEDQTLALPIRGFLPRPH